jgi:predicted phage baseplate assembly protein
MSREAPNIEDRSAKEIVDYLARRLDLAMDGADPLAEALIHIFARYCEIIIQRLNQVPEKNYLAFLNFLGVSRIPPFPAQVPLTFYPVKQLPQNRTSILVPAYTRVAAPADGGESEPVIFETVRPLELIAAKLCRIIAFDPQEDRYANWSTLTTVTASRDESAFTRELPVAHEFYIGHREIFGTAGISQLCLKFAIENRLVRSTGQSIEWWIPTSQGDVVLTPSEDTTQQLSQSGAVVFAMPPKWPAHKLFGQENYWLGCRLLTPVKSAPGKAGHTEFPLPRVITITISATWMVEGAAIGQAFYNNMPLDTSKDFFPLGERPRFGDVFYVSCEAFSRQGATVVLQITLTNPASAGEKAPIRPTNRQGKPEIQWETWNGERWIRLICRDETRALTETGAVSFTMPAATVWTSVNGQEGTWIRARLVSGHYGEEEQFELLSQEQPAQGLRRLASTLAPPAIHSISATCAVHLGPQPPEAVLTHNNLTVEAIDVGEAMAFLPFRPADNPWKSLYFGFQAPHRQVLADRTVYLYFQQVSVPAERLFSRDERSQPLSMLTWQYWNGRQWQGCSSVSDETACLTVSGVLRVGLGEDLSTWQASALDPELYWVRVLWEAGEFQRPPLLRWVALNTVLATHSLTLENELLGSSNGTANQTFRSARVPILGRLQLEVREPDMPAAEELNRLYQEEGKEAIRIVRNARGLIQEIWVRWHTVEDFLSSTVCDRHYVINRLSGEIQFGDGIKGFIPPAGANNIRLRSYQTGGGSHGNKPAGKITQLRTTVPFVDSVTNLEAATGGQDIEDWHSVRERGPHWLRHRDRAVTVEDYEDLAKEASPVVARVKCYPLRDLVRDPFARTIRPGVVSVVIIPHSADPSPKPTMELLRQVHCFLEQRQTADIDLLVLAPEYVRITVAAEVVPASVFPAVDVVAECEKRLDKYLHPLNGGPDGRGWPFGHRPQQSDLYALLENVHGLEYVHSLRISIEEERPGLLESEMFLVHSGPHRIRLRL